MKVEDITKRLQELEAVKKADLALEQRNEIANLYEVVLRKTFTATSCNDCYHDAVIEMLLYIRKHGDVKPYKRYLLKPGALLREGFGSDRFYVADTLTDEKAREFLRRDNSLLSLFARVPDDWNEPDKEKPAEGEEMPKEEAPVIVKRTRKKRK